MSTKEQACPRGVELSRAFSMGADQRMRSHLADCPRCADAWIEMQALRRLARELPTKAPSGAAREQMRTELLALADRLDPPALVTRGRWRWAIAGVAAVAVAAAITVAISARSPPRATARVAATMPTERGTLHAHGVADFVRAGALPDEIVRLRDGSMTVEVSPLHPGERFRVITGDAEVEVRGTAFDIAAESDRLTSVRVLHGHVEVRPVGGAKVLLGPGERWDRPATASAPPLLPPRVSPGPREATGAPGPAKYRGPHSKRSTPSPSKVAAVAPDAPEPPGRPTRSVAEAAFEEGWAALRSGDAAGAAAAFERAGAADAHGAVAEDAAFWRAVALGRAGRSAGAAQAFAAFIGQYPGSVRAGEASTMLGWLLLDAGDLDGADARFTAAEDDAVPEVRRSAQAGLSELARRRPRR